MKHWFYINFEDAEICCEHEIEERCEEMLNDCLEPVKIGDYTYEAGTALSRIDPIAFQQEVAAYTSDMFDEGYEDFFCTYDEAQEHLKNFNEEQSND